MLLLFTPSIFLCYIVVVTPLFTIASFLTDPKESLILISKIYYVILLSPLFFSIAASIVLKYAEITLTKCILLVFLLKSIAITLYLLLLVDSSYVNKLSLLLSRDYEFVEEVLGGFFDTYVKVAGIVIAVLRLSPPASKYAPPSGGIRASIARGWLLAIFFALIAYAFF